MLGVAGTRLLDDADLADVQAFLATEPIAGCLIANRTEAAGLQPRRLGAELWGYGGARLDAVCLSGSNLVPLGDSREAQTGFAERALRQGRRCSSIVGTQLAVDVLWERLEPEWGPAREVRTGQPLMAVSASPNVAPDPGVRRVRVQELDVLMPACVAMFTEEVGVSPLGSDGGRGYRNRVRELIGGGRAFARIEDGEVVFKAELGAVSALACQIQGVWVHPSRRGQGVGTAGTAAVVTAALRSVAPVVSLYVNGYNEPALRAYERIGFTRVGTFMSVLF